MGSWLPQTPLQNGALLRGPIQLINFEIDSSTRSLCKINLSLYVLLYSHKWMYDWTRNLIHFSILLLYENFDHYISIFYNN